MTVALTQCKAGVWQESLDDADREAFTFLRGAAKSMAELHETLTSVNYGVSLTTLKDHLTARCGCKQERG